MRKKRQKLLQPRTATEHVTWLKLIVPTARCQSVCVVVVNKLEVRRYVLYTEDHLCFCVWYCKKMGDVCARGTFCGIFRWRAWCADFNVEILVWNSGVGTLV